MIKYQLICDQKHEFEGWFQTSAAFAEQADAGLVRCPLCDSVKVKKALMAPNLASPKRRKTYDFGRQSEKAETAPAPQPAAQKPPQTQPTQNVTPSVRAEQVQAFGAALAELRQLQQKIKANCRDVGADFAEEARKIHYGETEAEDIYGQTTQKEREALEDEGIEIFDMPWLPSDH